MIKQIEKYPSKHTACYEEAMHDYKLVLACIQVEGGNPIISMMEQGYTESVARYIADQYAEDNII